MRRSYVVPYEALHLISPVFEGEASIEFSNGVVTIDGMLEGYPEAVVPQMGAIEVSPRQIRQALSKMGIRDQVEYAVSISNQDTRDWWEFSTLFESNHPEVVSMATQLNVTPAQLHEVFSLAYSL